MAETLPKPGDIKVVSLTNCNLNDISAGILITDIVALAEDPFDAAAKTIDGLADVLTERYKTRTGNLQVGTYPMHFDAIDSLKRSFRAVDKRFHGSHIPRSVLVLPTDMSIVPNTNSKRYVTQDDVIRFLLLADMKSTKWNIIGISAVECGVYVSPLNGGESIFRHFNCRAYKTPQSRESVNELLADSRKLASIFYEQEFRTPIQTAFESSARR